MEWSKVFITALFSIAATGIFLDVAKALKTGVFRARWGRQYIRGWFPIKEVYKDRNPTEFYVVLVFNFLLALSLIISIVCFFWGG